MYRIWQYVWKDLWDFYNMRFTITGILGLTVTVVVVFSMVGIITGAQIYWQRSLAELDNVVEVAVGISDARVTDIEGLFKEPAHERIRRISYFWTDGHHFVDGRGHTVEKSSGQVLPPDCPFISASDATTCNVPVKLDVHGHAVQVMTSSRCLAMFARERLDPEKPCQSLRDLLAPYGIDLSASTRCTKTGYEWHCQDWQNRREYVLRQRDRRWEVYSVDSSHEECGIIVTLPWLKSMGYIPEASLNGLGNYLESVECNTSENQKDKISVKEETRENGIAQTRYFVLLDTFGDRVRVPVLAILPSFRGSEQYLMTRSFYWLMRDWSELKNKFPSLEKHLQCFWQFRICIPLQGAEANLVRGLASQPLWRKYRFVSRVEKDRLFLHTDSRYVPWIELQDTLATCFGRMPDIFIETLTKSWDEKSPLPIVGIKARLPMADKEKLKPLEMQWRGCYDLRRKDGELEFTVNRLPGGNWHSWQHVKEKLQGYCPDWKIEEIRTRQEVKLTLTGNTMCTHAYVFAADREQLQSIVNAVRACGLTENCPILRLQSTIVSLEKFIFWGGRVIAVVFGLLSLLVLINSFASMVLRKKSEIGMLKAMGTSDGQIFVLYCCEALCIALISSCIGLLFGYCVGNMIGMSIASILEMEDICLFVAKAWLYWRIVLGTVIITMLAVVCPAWRACRIDPIEAIRQV